MDLFSNLCSGLVGACLGSLIAYRLTFRQQRFDRLREFRGYIGALHASSWQIHPADPKNGFLFSLYNEMPEFIRRTSVIRADVDSSARSRFDAAREKLVKSEEFQRVFRLSTGNVVAHKLEAGAEFEGKIFALLDELEQSATPRPFWELDQWDRL